MEPKKNNEMLVFKQLFNIVTVIFGRFQLKIVGFILVENCICFRVIYLVESYLYYELIKL